MVYGTYFSASLIAEGNDQEQSILELHHTIRINIKPSGALSKNP